MTPGATLLLNLRKSREENLEGWWLVDATYMTDGIGVLIVARPDVAERLTTDTNFTPDSLRLAAALLNTLRQIIPPTALLN